MQRSSGPERVGARSRTILAASSPVLPDAATADPDQAKTMLPSARPRHAAGLRFPRGRIERGEDGQAAGVPMELIGQCIEAIGRPVRSRAPDDAWRHAFFPRSADG